MPSNINPLDTRNSRGRNQIIQQSEIKSLDK